MQVSPHHYQSGHRHAPTTAGCRPPPTRLPRRRLQVGSCPVLCPEGKVVGTLRSPVMIHAVQIHAVVHVACKSAIINSCPSLGP